MCEEVPATAHVFQLKFIQQESFNRLVDAFIVEVLNLLRNLANLFLSLDRFSDEIRITVSNHLSTGKAFDRNQHNL